LVFFSLSLKSRKFSHIFTTSPCCFGLLLLFLNAGFIIKTSFFDLRKDPYEKNDIWSGQKAKLGKTLLSILKQEIKFNVKPTKVKELDPDLVEQLKSMGYMQ